MNDILPVKAISGQEPTEQDANAGLMYPLPERLTQPIIIQGSAYSLLQKLPWCLWTAKIPCSTVDRILGLRSPTVPRDWYKTDRAVVFCTTLVLQC